MFPRRERLPRASIESLLSHGKRRSSPHFTAVIAPRAGGYAVVVSKKVARLSVTRHRLKRRVLSALRALPSRPKAAIIFPKASANDLRYDEMHTELITLLS